MALLENHEKLKTDYEKRIKTIQNEIDRCDEFKAKIIDLELENKSKSFSIFIFYYYSSLILLKPISATELKAENQINVKNMQSEIDSQKMKIKGLEDILKRYREEDEIRNRKAHDMIKEVFKPSQVLNNI